MSTKIVYRDDRNSVFLGVCQGLADYFMVDVSIVRILTIVGFFVSMGTVFFAYIIIAIVIPPKSRLIRSGRLKRRARYQEEEPVRNKRKKHSFEDEYAFDPEDYKI